MQDSGFFTTVSSNGPADAIIWAVSRADSSASPPRLLLYALGLYDTKGMLHAQSIQRVKSSSAGWPPDR